MGINLGALIGPLLVGWFADRLGWRWGFALPALGMALGLAQFVWTRRHLGSSGLSSSAAQTNSWKPVVVLGAVFALIALLAMTGVLKINAVVMATAASWAMVLLGVVYFAYLLFSRVSRPWSASAWW